MKEFFMPDFLTINGGKPLDGKVNISGAKNEILSAMAAAVLTDQPFELHNVPYISDVLDLGHILIELGVDVKYSPENRILRMHAKKITHNVLPDTALKFRASYYLWGALLARFRITGEFDRLHIRLAGGCPLDSMKGGIGHGKTGRASDFHFNLLQNVFNIEIVEVGPCEYEFILPEREPENDDYPVYATNLLSHGATAHWMLATALSKRHKFMYHAIQEFEIPHLLSILNKMGASLRGTNTTAIVNMGWPKPGLLMGGTFDIMPDRMETGAYALLALATRGKILLENTDYESCKPWLNMLIESILPTGVRVIADSYSISMDFRGADLHGVHFICSPVPGKESDMQQVWMAAAATADSDSKILDGIWPDRSNMPQYKEFGVKMNYRLVDVDNFETPRMSIADIFPSKLHAANATGMDLRGTFGLIVLAATAQGKSRIDKPYFALRGYPNLLENLQGLGMDISCSDSGTVMPALPIL